MRRYRNLIAAGIAAAGIALAPATSHALTKEGAKQKFSEMVVEHLGKKSRGGSRCVAKKADTYRCTGRWQRTVESGNGGRVKLIVRARGGAFEDSEKIRSKAQLTKWKVVHGVKKGPFKGAFLMSTKYKPFD